MKYNVEIMLLTEPKLFLIILHRYVGIFIARMAYFKMQFFSRNFSNCSILIWMTASPCVGGVDHVISAGNIRDHCRRLSGHDLPNNSGPKNVSVGFPCAI